MVAPESPASDDVVEVESVRVCLASDTPVGVGGGGETLVEDILLKQSVKEVVYLVSSIQLESAKLWAMTRCV